MRPQGFDKMANIWYFNVTVLTIKFDLDSAERLIFAALYF